MEANKGVKVSASQQAQIRVSSRLNDMNISSAQESLDAARAGLQAEHDGVVTSVQVTKGTYAQETQTVFTIIPTEQIGVQFDIATADLSYIATGEKAKIRIGSDDYTGTVDFISRVIGNESVMTGNGTSNGNVTGKIVLDSPDDSIFIGASAKVYVYAGKSKDALVIPYEALNTDVDGDFVYVVNKEQLIERKDVTVGIRSDEYYEVLSGLEEGDRVIRNATSDMKPGDSYEGSGPAVVPPNGAVG